MGTIKAVIFDLDGTLVDSAPDIQVALNKLLAEERRRALTLEEVAAMIGDGAPKLVERAMSATGEGNAPEDLCSPLGISASRMAHELPLFSGREAIPLGPDAALGVAATGPC
jgi:phosphoglycolate phosphatase-like HAD superfamily hydrolase